MRMSSKSKRENGIQPKVRFPEFSGSWNVPTLGEISDRIVEKVGTKTLETVSISAGIGFVSQATKFSRDISGEQYKNYTVLNKGDFSYNKGNSKKFPQGCVYKLKEFAQVAAPNVFISFKFKKDYVADFYQGYFESNFHGEQLKKFITSGARSNGLLNISADEFFSVKLPTPVDRKEQQKISDCLSSLDELIAAEDARLEALQQHKKGLMQELFPAEGKTHPKRRFAEFQNTAKWHKSTIGEVGSFYYGKSAPKWSLAPDAPTLCVRYGELYTKFDTIISEVVSRTNIDPATLRFSKGGEILIPRVGERPEDFANCCYLPFPNIAIGEMISVYETKENPIFYAYYFRTLRKQFAKVVEGQNVKNLYYVNLEPIAVGIPPAEEQRKIAEVFSSIDAIILTQKQKLVALRDHKKGLMKQLFPTVSEVQE